LGKKIELIKHAVIKSVVALALGVNRKNIYRQSKRDQADLNLKKDIEDVWDDHPSYGHLRLAYHLKINHKRISRVMRKYGLKPPRRKIHHFCTVSTPHHTFTNLINGWRPIVPNQLWVADVSFIKFQGRFWYLSTIVDVFTRQVLAVQISRHHDHQLILSTLKQAVIITGTFPRVFHSDQGTEFMAQATIDFLLENGVSVSVSDKASPWQNGYQESFFGRFKDEIGDINRFETVGEFLEAIYQHVHYYNYDRIHTALKMPPATYAAMFS
jgi:transposase InsO family protein